MNLLAAESQRLLHRRAVWVVAGVLLVIQSGLLVALRPFSLNNALEASIGLGVGFAAVVAVLTCATYIGAEHSTNSISTLLTFEPRRGYVYLAKMATAALWSAAVAVIYLGLPLLGSLALLAINSDRYPDYVEPPSALWVGRFVLAMIVVMGFGTASAALAFITRGASTVIGLTAGYLVVVEGLVQSMLAPARPYLLINNIVAFIAGENAISYQVCEQLAYQCTWVERTILWPQAALILGLVWTALVVGGLVSLQQRDID